MADQEVGDNEQIPVRHWMRRHYIKLSGEKIAKCNHCSKFIKYAKNFKKLHHHLIKRHPGKLTENEKKEDIFISWMWDYCTPIDNMKAKCNYCNKILRYFKKSDGNLSTHLYIVHGITMCASADIDKDDLSKDKNMDTTIINAKHQEDSEALSSNSCENTEGTNVHNKKSEATFEQEAEDDKQIPIHQEDKFSWMWDYFTPENKIYAMCNFCDNIIKLYNKSEYTMKAHLMVYHRITGADNNTDGANNDTKKDTIIQ